MVAAWHQYEVLVLSADRNIQGAPTLPSPRGGGDIRGGFCVDPLEGEALFRVEAVVIELLEGSLDARFVLVVLMRRIGRPMTGRRQHFHDEDTRSDAFLGKDPVNPPLSYSFSARL